MKCEIKPIGEIECATAVWETVMAQVPTEFGKLLWVSSFRVAGGDQYRHPALDQMFSRGTTSQVLQENHYRLFQNWLEMGLQKQHDDFVQYMEEIGFRGEPKDFLNDVRTRLAPASIGKPHELLFDTDLAVVRELVG